MSVFVNAHLVYGFVETETTKPFFRLLQQKMMEKMKDESLPDFECWFQELRKEHDISFYCIGEVQVISVFSASASAKTFDCQKIDKREMSYVSYYDAKLHAFLQEIGIDLKRYTPNWYLLGYID